MGRFLDIIDSIAPDRAANDTPADPPELTEAVADLREHWAERAAVLEFDAHLPRDQAEAHAAAMACTLARNRGYPWRALRLALPPHLAAEVPDAPEPVDRLLWGPPKLAILPGRRVIPQGVMPRR